MFEQPIEVSDLEVAFAADVSHLMPAYAEIKDWARTPEAQPFIAFQRTWFFQGLAGDTELHLKPDINYTKAIRHLRCIQGSFEPKHEHKEAGVAWLLHQWSEAPPKAVPAKKIGV